MCEIMRMRHECPYDGQLLTEVNLQPIGHHLDAGDPVVPVGIVERVKRIVDGVRRHRQGI